MRYFSNVLKIITGILFLCCLTPRLHATIRTVTSNGNGTGAGTLRNAVTSAAIGDTVEFNASVTQIDLSGSGISIGKSLVIIGNGADSTTITGSSSVNIFSLNTTTTMTVRFHRLTLRSGVGTVANSGVIGGGAIYLDKGTLFATDCEFRDNVANQGGGGNFGYGGACMIFSDATFTRCTFDNNSVSGTNAEGGGAFYFDDFFRALAVVCTNCTFFNNSCTDIGGAIHGAGGSGNTNSLTVTNCTFYNNNASGATGSCIYYNMGNGATATFITHNTIYDRIAGSPPVSVRIDGSGGTRTTRGGNIWHDNPSGISPIASDRAGNGNGDAGLKTTLALNGGETRTLAINSGASNAVDFGTTGFAEPAKDQRNYTRQDALDAGSYEFNATFSYIALAPTTGATNVARSTTLTISFDDLVTVGSGNLLIKKVSDNSVVQTISTSNTTGSGTRSITITPPVSIAGSAVYVEIPSSFIVGPNNSPFTAISGSSTWNFTLAGSPPVVTTTNTVVSTLEDNALDISVNIGDAETATSALVVTATSSNLSVVPNANIVQQGATAATTVLKITPVADANGPVTITVTATDTDGDQASTTFTLTITSVNDAPSFVTTTNVTVNEGGGFNAPVVASVVAGPANESGQVLTWHVSTDNSALFGAQPNATTATGNLFFSCNGDAVGSTLVHLYLSDDGGIANGGQNTSATLSVTVTILPVNDAPTINTVPSFSMFKDAPSTTVTLTGIGAGGGPDEAGQNLTVTATSSNVSIIPDPTVNYTSANVTGNLQFAPLAGTTGTVTITVRVTDDGGIANGGVTTSTTTFTVTVIPINNAPSFSTGANVSSNEDTPYNAAFATAIDDGNPEAVQVMTFHVSNDNNALFSVQPSVTTATGNLSFTPAANAIGTAVVTISLSDDGGTAAGGVNTSATQTFTITINPVNDAPTINTVTNFGMLEDAATTTVTLTGIGVGGGPDEVGQTLTVTATSSNVSIIPNPTVNYTSANVSGNLQFAPLSNTNGTVTITVRVTDNGGTANGGVTTSTTTFTVTVVPVNDAPVFSTGANVAVNEDSGPYNAAFATGISAGGAGDEAVQVLTFQVTNNNASLFAVQPSVTSATGNLTFTPALNANGTAVVSVYLMDNGGTANGGQNTSATQTFTITINPVNDAPTINSVTSFGMFEDAATTTVTLTGIGAGPANETGQTLTVTATSSNVSIIPNPTVNYTSANVSGNLQFAPVANANGVVTITVTVTDNGGTVSGGVTTSTTTFTVTVVPVNDAPTIAASSASVTTTINVPATFAVFLADIDNAVNTLVVTATSSNIALITNAGITQSGATGATTFLTATPLANQTGTAVITVTVSDGQLTASTQVSVTVSGAPVITTIATAIGILEDATTTLSVSLSDPDTPLSSVIVTATSSNQSLFPNANLTMIGVTGATTQFLATPAANANGSAQVTLTASDGFFTSATTFTVTVTAVNDAPVFSTGSNVTVNEDSGAYNAAFATGIGAGGGADESGQVLTFQVTNSNAALFSVQPSVTTATGNLSFTPAANANGVATVSVYLMDNGGTLNGGVNTSATKTFTITVNAVNDAPTVSAVSGFSMLEDAASTTVSLTGIGAGGGADEAGQTLTITATSSNVSIIPDPTVNYTSANVSGNLQFAPLLNANGIVTITVRVSDNGGTANGGVNQTVTSFTVTVTPVNDAPGFNKGSNVTVNEDSGAYNATFATLITPGGGTDEASQVLTFQVTNNNAALFSVQPTINSSTGNLSFTPAADANGIAVVSAYLMDNGGTLNGGVNTSATKTFTITVTAVNDAPTISAIGSFGMLEDAASTTVTLTGITVGPANEAGQVLTITATSSNVSIIPNPTVNYTSANISGNLQFAPAANANGTVTITVTVSDNGGVANGGINQTVTTFTVTVTPVNDAPVFSTGSNVTVNEDNGAYNAAFATGISPGGGADEVGQVLTFQVTNSNAALFSVQPVINSSTGNVSFTPAADANGVAVVSVYLMDNGGTLNGGVNTSATQTFTITVNAVNDAPSFVTGANQVALDEDGAHTVSGWATAISVGPANESSQSVQFIVTSNNTSLFSVQPAVSSTGTLSYTPAPGQSGVAVVSIYAMDNGGTAFGGVATSATQTFTISISLSPVTQLRVASVTPVPAQSGQNIAVVVESRTALGTLRATTATTTLGLVTGNSYLQLLSGSTQASLSAGASTTTITMSFFSSSTANVSVTAVVRDLSNILASTQAGLTVNHAVPSGLGGTVDNQRVSLSWTAPVAMNVTGYAILRGTVSGSLSEIATTTATAFTDNTVANGGIYFYAVKSASGGLRSGQTAEVSFTIPAVVTNLTATAQINAIRLDWSGSTSAGVTGYEIYSGLTSGNLSLLTTVAATSSSYTQTGLSDGARRYYALKTLIGSNQKSAFSNEATAAPNTLRVLVPNGGEHWQAGSHQTISWLYSGDISRMRLEFSYDGGANWSPLSETVLPTANRDPQIFYFDWEVPDIPTTTALVHVLSLGGDAVTMSDQSDTFFEIVGVVAPVNLVATAGSTTISLSWGASTTASISGYRVLRGLTSGSLTVLANNVGVTTSYIDASATSCTTYYYAVQALLGSAHSPNSNVSSATIVLPGSFTVTSPNGGEVWQAGLVKQIMWTSTGCNVSANATLEYSTDNGGSWSTIATVANSGSYSWTVPNIPSVLALVRVSGIASGNFVSDVSNAVFTIALIAPPTGLTAISGTAQVSLLWTPSVATGVTAQSVYRGTTSSSLSLLATLSAGVSSYVDVTVANCTTYYYAVQAMVGSFSSANSNVTSATPQIVPGLVLTSPNGGEVWQVGTSQMITWSSTGCTISPTVALEYSTNNGVTWTTINGSATNNGSYSWTVPSVSTTQARVRVNDGSLLDMSDATFTINSIAPPTNLSASAGNGQVSLSWTLSGSDGQTAQEVWRGTSAGSLAMYATVSTSATSYVDATAANCTTYFYAVRTMVGANPSAFSNVTSATPQIPPAVTVLSPNGGEVWQAGLIKQITWTSTGCSVSATVMIEYSINNGGSWSTIVASTSNSGTYNWGVPNTPSTQARVRITGGSLVDMSDAVFTITPLPIPSLSAVAVTSVSYCVNSPSPLTLNVNVSDPVYPVSTLTLTISSSNPSVLPNAAIAQSGATAATTVYVLSPTTNASGSAVLTITASNGLAISSTTVTVNITVNARPSAGISGSSSVCASRTTSYSVASATGNLYSWNVSGGAITSGQGSSSVNVLWGGAGAGAVSITVINASGCSQSSSSNVTINSNPVPVISANGSTILCPGSSVQLTANAAVSYQWSNGATSQSIIATTAATYSVTMFNASGCSASTSVTVTVLPQVLANAGGDRTICAGGSTQLAGSGTVVNGVVIFHWSPATGLSNPDIANPIATPGVTTVYTLTVSDLNGCTVTSQATVTVLPALTVSAGSNVSICAGSSTQLQATGGISYHWSPAVGLDNPDIANPLASPAATTTYTVLVTNDVGCSASASVIVTVNVLPVADAGADITLCSGQSAQLQATGGLIYSWSPVEGLSNPTIANPIASPDVTTTYTVTVTNVSGCSSTDVVVVSRNALTLNVTAILEGAYNGSTMNTLLAGQGMIPTAQPYTGAPFNYAGSESASIGANIVDWVLVELRTSDMSTVGRKAALIRSDGRIVGTDGGAVLMSPTVGAGSYYIVVRHRNHLAIMSSIAVSVDSQCGISWNFMSGESQAYEQFALAMKQLGGGVFAMAAGDVNGDGVDNAADRAIVRNTATQTGYVLTDVSLDGIVNATDRVLVRNNTFMTTQVP